MIKKVQEFLAAAYPIFLLVMATICLFIERWDKSILFILLYAVCLIGDRLRDIHKSISVLWYRIYLRNKKDGIE
ncbi:MAG: hypothetical protein ACLSE5_20585 [Enterococcus avium]